MSLSRELVSSSENSDLKGNISANRRSPDSWVNLVLPPYRSWACGLLLGYISTATRKGTET